MTPIRYTLQGFKINHNGCKTAMNELFPLFRGEKVVNDGPFVEGKEIVRGYPLIKASDLPDAIEIAKNCPIFDCDGIVEVREVHQLPNKKLSSLRRPGLALAALCERTLSLPCTPQACRGNLSQQHPEV